MKPKKHHTLLRFLKFLHPHRGLAIAMVCIGVSAYGLYVGSAELIRLIADRAIADKDMFLLGVLALGLLALEGIKPFAIYQQGLCSLKLRTRMVADVRCAVWRHLQRMSLAFHHSLATGSLLSRLINDINVAQQIVSHGLAWSFIQILGSAIAITRLFFLDWKLALVSVAILPAYYQLFRKLKPRLRSASQELQEKTATMTGHAAERLNAVALVQSLAKEPAETQKFTRHARETRDADEELGKLGWFQAATSNTIVQLSTLAVWVIGGLMVIGDEMTIGEIIQFTLILALLYGPIQQLSNLSVVFQTSMASIDRVFRVFDIAPEIVSSRNAVSEAPTEGKIEFVDVGFYYHDKPPILDGVSFAIQPGERVAIVGESGAGKSTLVTLIPRLYDVTSGNILVDGIDVRKYRLKTLRRSIGFVLQESLLLSGTIRENLRYARLKATMKEIIEAARKANAHDFIMSFPYKYDTLVGERGVLLSVGQKQRISIARAFLQDPLILILDEPTSALDSQSESLVSEALLSVEKGRTCLIIAHRLSTVVGADRILVMKDGRVVEQGKHSDLIARNGAYRDLFNHQFRTTGGVEQTEEKPDAGGRPHAAGK